MVQEVQKQLLNVLLKTQMFSRAFTGGEKCGKWHSTAPKNKNTTTLQTVFVKHCVSEVDKQCAARIGL